MMYYNPETPEQINAAFDALTFVTTLRDTMGSVTVIRAILETSHKEWDNSFDQNSGDHLIKGVFTSGQKTDAIKTYISKLMAQYMRSIGVRATAWTKNTIASENFTNVAISNKIAATQFQSHEELFQIVATRLMGFDDGLIAFALKDEPKAKAEALVTYLADRFDLVTDRDQIKVIYQDTIDFFEKKFDTPEGVGVVFLKDLLDAINVYHTLHRCGLEKDARPLVTDPLELVIEVMGNKSSNVGEKDVVSLMASTSPVCERPAEAQADVGEGTVYLWEGIDKASNLIPELSDRILNQVTVNFPTHDGGISIELGRDRKGDGEGAFKYEYYTTVSGPEAK